MTTSNLFFKGFNMETNFNSELLGNLLQYEDWSYYLTFSKLINLDKLRDNILDNILDNNNSKIVLRRPYGKIIDKKPLMWNKFYNMLTYYNKDNLYTLQINRAGVKIFPSSSNYDENLNLALGFISQLEKANLLEVD